MFRVYECIRRETRKFWQIVSEKAHQIFLQICCKLYQNSFSAMPVRESMLICTTVWIKNWFQMYAEVVTRIAGSLDCRIAQISRSLICWNECDEVLPKLCSTFIFTQIWKTWGLKLCVYMFKILRERNMVRLYS